MYHAIAKRQDLAGEICNRAKDGSIYWVDTPSFHSSMPPANPGNTFLGPLALRVTSARIPIVLPGLPLASRMVTGGYPPNKSNHPWPGCKSHPAKLARWRWRDTSLKSPCGGAGVEDAVIPAQAVQPGILADGIRVSFT